MQTTKSTQQYRIGEIASKLGINTKTIRYYEEIGLVPEPARTTAGYRMYSVKEREQLRFIIKAKATGLTLEEIGEILILRRNGQMPCDQVLAMLDRKLGLIDQQVQALLDFRGELLTIRSEATSTMDSEACVCGIIEQHEPLHQSASSFLRRVHETAMSSS